MGRALVKNNAYSTLASSITDVATSLTVQSGQGARFPVISAGSGNFFYASLINSSNQIEVVKVIGTATDVFTITRGQDGTTARAYAALDRVELRPTAALFDDKVSLGGGTLTGYLVGLSGATGSQIPRASDVVLKSGDEMTGSLSVPELRGPANIITIPDGHSIYGDTAGTVRAPGMIVQTFTKYVTAKTSFAAAASGTIEVTDLTCQFTPKYADSQVLIMAMISGEASESNFTWRIQRDGSNIGLSSTSRYAGLWNGDYDANNTTTPQTRTYFYVDTPGVASQVEYQFHMAPSGASALTFRLNRAYNSSGADDNEVAISMVLIQEIAQ